MSDTPVTLPLQCSHCGSGLTVEVDRQLPDLRHRQGYLCPACTKHSEGVFTRRVVRVTRRWGTT